ncbi:quinon protein alcohol dehydrogenase-like superfamily [Hyaloraphidium curvatum]|nr:quinon protein alcohol dehydrogenase-like superfamily [Hyaloraphidium curvatum]
MPGETKLAVPRPANPSPSTPYVPEAKPVAPGKQVVAQFKSPDGEVSGPPLNLPADANPEILEVLLNQLLKNDDPVPYSFYVDDQEIVNSIYTDLIETNKKTTEHIISIVYQPQAIFKVRPVTRCTSSMEGHTEAVLSCHFSPDGSQLATGSGDTTIRIWDVHTETAQSVLRGHTNWVEVVAWSPDGNLLASGGMDNTVRIWDPKTGKQLGDALKGHRQCVTSVAWEPIHMNANCNRLATASKDATVRVWDTTLRRLLFTLGGHTQPVMCVKWGGEGLIYTASRDKTIKVWDARDGKLVRSLEGHAHWVNHLALSTESVLRTGSFDERSRRYTTKEEAQAVAKERYEKAKGPKPERLVSCSDDFTMFIWEPSTSKKPIARMTGHQQPITHVSFSPNGLLIASSSFDKSIKLWDGNAGTFLATLRGHVGAVYQNCFSPDSRLLVSGSKDTTLKVWDMKTRKLKLDLPGHADEVFAVDWAPGSAGGVGSGGKDKVVKMWRH